MPQPSTVIRLDDLLKLEGVAGTGGHAKMIIQNGQVSVNGQLETRRRRQLCAGDCVHVENESETVEIVVHERHASG